LKAILAARLEPLPVEVEPDLGAESEPVVAEQATILENETEINAQTTVDDQDQDSRSDMDDFATPPTSAPASPSRSRAQTLNGQTWPVKPGGILDRSNTESSSLHPVICSKIAAAETVREIHLQHNLFTVLPESLSFFAETLTVLSLSHNQLVGETYIGSGSLALPALKELNLASNHITGLGSLTSHLQAPNLQKLDVSFNRISTMPQGCNLKAVFPSLGVLLISNNHLDELDPEAIKGLRIVDAANNDIAHLNPRLGLLGGSGGLERLEVMGNRFRVPRWNVLERGTEATLRWLRSHVPIAEMAAWKDGDEEGEGWSGGDTSLADVD
jgi:Leucine-rich repeat (LRR) protein